MPKDLTPKIDRVPGSACGRERGNYRTGYDFVFSDNIEDWIHNRKRRETPHQTKYRNGNARD